MVRKLNINKINKDLRVTSRSFGQSQWSKVIRYRAGCGGVFFLSIRWSGRYKKRQERRNLRELQERVSNL